MHHAQGVRKTNVYDLLKTEAQSRLHEFRDNPASRSLAEEVALGRVMLENLMREYGKSPTQLLANTPAITAVLREVRSTLDTHIKLEQRQGDLLPYNHVVKIAQALFQAVVDKITDEESIEQIALAFEDILRHPERFADASGN